MLLVSELMAAIVLAAVAYDAHKERKEEARSNG